MQSYWPLLEKYIIVLGDEVTWEGPKCLDRQKQILQ